MTRTPTTWARTLADQFAHGFSSEAPGTRTIGREAEFPIVNESGWAGSVQNVLRAAAQQNPEFKTKSEGSLLVEVEGPQFSLAAEVGIGTVELITGPCSDLSSLESQHLSGLECLLRATEATQTRVLGLGIQPRSLATPTLMCEKARYGVLHERMGQDWLWFTLTASDQVHVDIGLDELAAVTNTTSLLTAATVGLCGNSSIYHDRSSGVCSAREHLMGKIFSGDHRHGMPAGPIDSWTNSWPINI